MVKTAAAKTTTPIEQVIHERGSLTEDEQQGLARKLVEHRQAQDERHLATNKALGELRGEIARIIDRQKTIDARLDALQTEWQRDLRAIQEQKRAMDQDVLAAGQSARKMADHVKALDELRETQVDPRELMAPLQRSLQLLANDLEAYKKNVDSKLERLPRPKAPPVETR